jgi:hypothetical protein
MCLNVSNILQITLIHSYQTLWLHEPFNDIAPSPLNVFCERQISSHFFKGYNTGFDGLASDSKEAIIKFST